MRCYWKSRLKMSPRFSQALANVGDPRKKSGAEAAEAASGWLHAEVPVDEHLADQLLLPMALAGGGSFRTVKPSLHSTTNARIIERFLSAEIRFKQETAGVWRVDVN